MFLNEVMEERRKICNSENGPIWATPENLPFLKYEIYLLFSYSYGSKVPKWKCAHILLCKKYKNCLKLLNIAEIQPSDWIQRKKKHPVLIDVLQIAIDCFIHSILSNQSQHFRSFLSYYLFSSPPRLHWTWCCRDRDRSSPTTFLSLISGWRCHHLLSSTPLEYS